MINEPLWTIWGIEYDLEIVMMGTGLHATVQFNSCQPISVVLV